MLNFVAVTNAVMLCGVATEPYRPADSEGRGAAQPKHAYVLHTVVYSALACACPAGRYREIWLEQHKQLALTACATYCSGR